MRHGRKTIKLQRRQDHRNSLLSNLVCSLIEHKQIKTTLAKAKAVRPFAEKMVTLGKRGDLHARRTALSYLHQKPVVKELFEKIAPAAASRQGGYTRITKLGQRHTDSAEMAYIEWVDQVTTAAPETPVAAEAPKA
jgi:large subunit ribosomal protein L17